MTGVHAVILAGGRGERLGGVSKAQIRIGGIPLIERVAAALTGCQAPILVAIGHRDQGALPADSIGVADLDDRIGGPLAGLAAAADWLSGKGISGGLLVSVAVDTPFLPKDYIMAMRRGLGSAQAGYARWGQAFYPTNSIWQISALAGLPEQVRAGTAPRSPRALLETLGGVPIDWHDPQDPFANLNTAPDLVALGRRAKLAR